jgi:serine/threonine protein kinase
MAIAPSTLLLPGYQLVEPLYQTAKTLVYRAVEESPAAHPVVIKVHPTAADQEQQRLQLRHQYTIAKPLNLPGIVCPERLEPYASGDALVMPDWGGVSLRTWMQRWETRSDPLSPANRVLKGLTIALQLNDILHDLHQNHIVHQTIQPAHILIHPLSKQLKLIDFSLAVELSADLQILRHPPGFAAQERSGMPTGAFQADFAGLGATLFELLTGQPLTTLDLESIQTHIPQALTPICGFNPALTN